MNISVTRMKAFVSHWTCVALMSNSAMIVGNAVINRNWLKVNKKAAAMITTTTPLLSILSSAIPIPPIVHLYSLLHNPIPRSKHLGMNKALSRESGAGRQFYFIFLYSSTMRSTASLTNFGCVARFRRM